MRRDPSLTKTKLKYTALLITRTFVNDQLKKVFNKHLSLYFGFKKQLVIVSRSQKDYDVKIVRKNVKFHLFQLCKAKYEEKESKGEDSQLERN